MSKPITASAFFNSIGIGLFGGAAFVAVAFLLEQEIIDALKK